MNLLNKLQKKIEERAAQKEKERAERLEAEFLSAVPTELLKRAAYGSNEAEQSKAIEEIQELYDQYYANNGIM